jgi:hypothetical protein
LQSFHGWHEKKVGTAATLRDGKEHRRLHRSKLGWSFSNSFSGTIAPEVALLLATDLCRRIFTL